jgi:hypothetical protein
MYVASCSKNEALTSAKYVGFFVTVVIRYSMMLYRSVIVCLSSGPTPAANTNIRRNCLRNGKRRSLYPSITMVIRIL